MPSVSYYYGDIGGDPFPFIPFIYNRKPKVACINIHKTGVIGLIDLVDKTFVGIDGAKEDSPIYYKQLIDFNLSGSKLKTRIFYGHNNNNSWRLADIEIDLSALTASRTLIAEKTSSDDADITYKIKKGKPLSQRTILVAESDKPYIWYVDAKDLTIVNKWDTGFSTYNPRLSNQIVVKPDDIYMLVGRHLDSANFYKFAVYGKTLTEISNSNPNTSPNPMILNMWVTHKERILTGSGNTVVTRNNLICWFDDDFNLLGKTNLSGIYSYPFFYGAAVIGKTSTGNLVIVGLLYNEYMSNATENTLIYIEIDPSDYSLANYQKLKTFTDLNNAPERLAVGLGTDTDRLALPIIDIRTKKVYIPARIKSAGTNYLGLVVFDLSDVDIVEWNQHAWYLNQTTIPTFLDLNIVPQ